MAIHNDTVAYVAQKDVHGVAPWLGCKTAAKGLARKSLILFVYPMFLIHTLVGFCAMLGAGCPIVDASNSAFAVVLPMVSSVGGGPDCVCAGRRQELAHGDG
jgi:hypothetical protein